jgi:carbonic anhydrase
VLSLVAFGCNQLKALAGANKEKKEKPPAAAPIAPLAGPDPAAHEAAPAAAGAHAATAGEAKAATEPASGRYGVPFAWETSPNEPLAKARGFLAEVLQANQANVALGRTHFVPFVDGQTPRATVVTCADSRVQASAWDQTPENDDFTIRNIGNQVSNGLGSIEYGVEHLHTPLLLVVGHTGCGAVKAALGKTDSLAAPIQEELKALKLPAPRKGASPEQVWTEAVNSNVHAQVALATQHFAEFVHSGELTVIGAVYDFRNELGKGYGRLQIINVNTNTEQSRIDAFLKAVQRSSAPNGPVTVNGKPVSLDESMEDRVKKILDRAQRALPGPKPNVTVSAAEAGGHEH